MVNCSSRGVEAPMICSAASYTKREALNHTKREALNNIILWKEE